MLNSSTSDVAPDRHAARASLEGVGVRHARAAHATPDPLLAACRAVGQVQGIEFRAPPADLGEASSPSSLGALCAASALRCRRVLLEVQWWRRTQGPLLGFCRQPEGAGRPVALLPGGRGGYVLFDPVLGTRAPLDAELAHTLEPAAFVFYRPLPARALGLRDLLGAGLRGCGTDLLSLLAASLSAGAVALLTPALTRRLVDESIARSERADVGHVALALGVGACAAALLEWARALTLLRIKSKTAVAVEAALWDRLLTLPTPFYRRFTVGDLSARAMGINQLQYRLTADVTSGLFAALSAVFSLAILFYYSRPLAFVVSAATLLLGLLVSAAAGRQLRHLRELHLASGRLGGFAYALLCGIAKLRVGGAESRAFAQWARRFGEQRALSLAVQRLTHVQSLLGTLYGAAATTAVFAVVGLSDLRLGVGDYLAFSAAFAQFQVAALAAIGVVPTLLAFVPTYERLKPILETLPESGSDLAAPGRLRGALELRDVTFEYRPGTPVLRRLSLRAEPGQFVALVGPSGCGKTTILRLMLGFERPLSGCVSIDGREVGALDMQRVRRQLGVVLQNGRPLVGDVLHNIIGSLPLTLEDAWRAAEWVGLAEDIRAMPMGMFTLVNQRGVAFSGGQRQRLLLARALVTRPRVLLLDEATSALDNVTQEVVSRTLATLGVTRIVIAHRLCTVRRADRIYVLAAGGVAEEGTFDELLARGGMLARLARQQRL